MFGRFIGIAALCVAALAQTPKTEFEVASVKTATPLGPMGMRSDRKGGPGTPDPGTYICHNCPVSWVLSEAYDNLQPWEWAGPDWLNQVRFDFDAKVPSGATKEAFQGMLQRLLADRFKMTAHREKRAMQIFELTVGRGGAKFHEAAPKDAAAAKDEDTANGRMQRDKDGFPILTGGVSMAVVPGHARIRSDNQTMAWFARMMAGQLQGPVVDSTGLPGKYDFTVSWAFEESGGTGSASVDTYHPALIEAVQSQLGLKLEKKRSDAGVLVIDHIEKTPSAN